MEARSWLVTGYWATFGLLLASVALAAPFDQLDPPAVETPKVDKPKPNVPSPKPPADVNDAILSVLRTESPREIPDDPSDRTEGAPAGTSPSQEAIAAFQAGNIDECLSHLRVAVAQQPTLPPPKLILADMYMKAGQLATARELLEAQSAEETTHPQLALSFANLALVEGRLTDALAHLRWMEAQGVPASWSDADKAWFANAMLQGKISIAERQGKWEQAQTLLAQWVQMHPTQGFLRHRYAGALLAAGRGEKAFEQFDIAYQQDKKMSVPEVAMGVLHMGRGEVAKANDWYERALASHPNNADVHAAWSMALLYQNRATEAAEHAAKAVAGGIDEAKLDVQRGIIFRQQKKYAAAEQHLTRALARNPRDDEAAYHLVLTLVSQRDEAKLNQALKLSRACEKSLPGSPLVSAALGASLHAQGELNAAESALRTAAAHPQARPEMLYLLGRVLAAGGKRNEAQQVASQLEEKIDVPGIFVLRGAAKDWLATVAKAKP